ncbi:MAG: hypothetical protein IJY50_00280 [Clostridia bacterium]|nr:hypothetical protein [Clostridia bacterium]
MLYHNDPDNKQGPVTPKRLANWWVHWADLNWPSGDGLDRIKRKAERFAEANITTAVLFGAHFRWDYLPYFTLLHDYIATVAEELHQRGVELYDRHSVNLIHRYDTREQMRHVMLHSGPHLPFSPSREAAASWTYKGKRLNDWRMIDVRNGSVLYYPQYAAEGFCHRNPDYLEAYCDYAKRLVADTGIDGLSAEDPVHYMHYISCGCPHCRAELKRRAGVDLPPPEDRSFWGNWENPAWRAWIDLRYDAGKAFFEKLQPCLPKGFPITTCGANSASPSSNGKGSDARHFLAGSNYVNNEMSGNTPPYQHDPVTVNIPIAERLVASSHHQAAAREKGVRCFSTGYGFTQPAANIIWAVNKMLDLDCCFSTLKARLGLPQHLLDRLPATADAIGAAFGFEKAHPWLFSGRQIGQLGVYFSYETRDHTFFGNLNKGYYKDYADTLRLLFHAGISPHTVFDFPKDPATYPVILLSGVAAMTKQEQKDLYAYLEAGGRVIATGPTPLAECHHSWQLPTRPTIGEWPEFYSTIANGVWHKAAKWVTDTVLPPSGDPDAWQQPLPGLYYHPHRMGEIKNPDTVLEICRQFMKKMPVEVIEAQGYLITVFEGENGTVVHLLAEDYDTDIDHHLDEIRFHRSRVNYINRVTAVGTSAVVRIAAGRAPDVYTPFETTAAKTEWQQGICTVTLPEHTAYAILHFPKA